MLKGKSAIITGASRGIGKAIAIKFAKEGANIVINYRNNEEEALKVKEELEQLVVKTLILKKMITPIQSCSI